MMLGATRSVQSKRAVQVSLTTKALSWRGSVSEVNRGEVKFDLVEVIRVIFHTSSSLLLA